MKQQTRFYLSLFTIGAAAGLVGVCLTWLLHHIQHWAFGYGGSIHTFREGAAQTPVWRRIAVLSGCGAVAGLGWYVLQRYGTPLVSIKKSLEKPQQGLPFAATTAHALLQIVTVGLGSPLGREVAPREMSAAFASLWLRRVRLNDEDAKLLLACASGAGLAAVYNVPFAATLFILETMVLLFNPRALTAALCTVVTATAVSRLFLGDLVQYGGLPEFAVTLPLLFAAPFIGFAAALCARLFQASTKRLPLLPRKHPHIIWLSVAAFCLIGILSAYLPEILGNGKAGNQLTFAVLTDAPHSLQMAAFKWLAVLLALAAGAYGGLITPSMMLGSTLSYAAVSAWNICFPHLSVPLEGAAIVGAAAFLGISLNMPLTAVVFLLELTRSPAAMLMPLCLALAAALPADHWWRHRSSADK